ncbi:MAG: nascent polypeptide-associated complex protein [Thermoprotei archaeon]|nr:MAG: nascent polypeptide-associated complex protein [Thermoprotei archaeon]RLF22084.1 MAG: nascent polypeptide-associated complex protein [Thermoprotei archaeon]
MMGMNPRELRRMMQMMRRSGLNVEQMEGVELVTVKLRDKELVVEQPQVMVMKIGGQTILQVMGNISERTPSLEEVEVPITDEDVQLVASQAGVSLEEARKALKATKGDLAKAILYLKSL